MSGRVAGLLLAAGEGRRLGMPKALVEFDGQTLVARGAGTLAATGCDPVVVVVGAAADEVRQRLPGRTQAVDNPGWRAGMGSSLRAGLAALPADAAAVVILLVDQPWVGAEAVGRVIGAWRRGALAAVATYDGHQRNPVLLDRSLWEEAAAAAVGDMGARALLRARPWLVTPVPCEDVADPSDLDAPGDLAAARRKMVVVPDRGGVMQLNHSFTVPASVEHAWEVLRDIRRVGPCMPGATIDEVDGDEFTGRVKVKVGPMQVAYKGRAAFTELDVERHRAVIEARGQETRGSGTASATITAELTERDGETEVTVMTDLAITGRPAQFGRGVMADVGEKLLGQFADCLARKLSEKEPEPAAAADAGRAADARTDEPAPSAAARPEPTPAFARMGVEEPEEPEEPEEAAIDLLSVAGQPLLKRVAPLAALAALALLVWLIRRR